MRSMEYINEQIVKMNRNEKSQNSFKKIYQKELKELSDMLKDNESLDYLDTGLYEKEVWVLGITNLRVVLLHKGLFYGFKQKEIMLDNISSIKFEKELMFAKLFIEENGLKTNIIGQINKNYIAHLVQVLNENINLFKNNLYKDSNINIQGTTNAKDELIDKIKQLAELKEQGILTEKEFTLAKEKLLTL